MNKAILIGRMVRDAEIRWNQGENQTCIARFTLAVNRKYAKQGEKDADFISCIAFGKTAEFLERYGHKGVKFVVEGRIQTGSYTNRDGQKVYTTDVVVESIEFGESKSAAASNNNADMQQNQQNQAQTDENGFMMIQEGLEEELPFN